MAITHTGGEHGLITTGGRLTTGRTLVCPVAEAGKAAGRTVDSEVSVAGKVEGACMRGSVRVAGCRSGLSTESVDTDEGTAVACIT